MKIDGLKSYTKQISIIEDYSGTFILGNMELGENVLSEKKLAIV